MGYPEVIGEFSVSGSATILLETGLFSPEGTFRGNDGTSNKNRLTNHWLA
jgi:hypothetical protein